MKPLQVALLSLLLLAAPLRARAEAVLERVARTGVLTAGTSKDSIPFAFRNEEGELIGYSIDMLEQIRSQLAQQLGRTVALQLVAIAPEERIPKIGSGDVDIVCDASSFTWERDRQVDFSISYSVTGTRLLVKRGSSIWGPETLVGKRVGALAQTTNEAVIRQVQPQAEVVQVRDRADAYAQLQAGTLDAFSADGILLEGWLLSQDNPQDYQIVGYPYSREGIACMVPENNSQFLHSVNWALTRFMQGLLRERPEDVAIFDRWFGPHGVVPLNQDLRSLALESMQFMIDYREPIPDEKL